MIGLARTAKHLDAWLRAHVGRPYNAILGVGLVLSIGDSIRSLGQDFVGGNGFSGGVAKLALLVVFQTLLLVNQLAQIEERREARRNRHR